MTCWGLCREAGLVSVGVITIDGTKIKANASMDQNRSLSGDRRARSCGRLRRADRRRGRALRRGRAVMSYPSSYAPRRAGKAGAGGGQAADRGAQRPGHQGGRCDRSAG